MKATLYRGDCLDVLAAMEPESVDAIVCDPPYGLGFMGRAWDALPPGEDWARLCLRVLKPGGHLVAFGGTRTVHRLATAIEDGGFEIRDMVSWLYWSGFPKSLDVSKAIDKRRYDRDQILQVTAWIATARDAAGLTNRKIDEAFGFAGMAGHWTSQKSQPSVPTLEQVPRLLEVLGVDAPPPEIGRLLYDLNGRKGEPGEAWGRRDFYDKPTGGLHGGTGVTVGRYTGAQAKPGGATEDARTWEGYGTALKPAQEPAVLARKPLTGTVAANVLEHGTGALNIDGCRFAYCDPAWPGPQDGHGGCNGDPGGLNGRWPANIYAHPKASRSEREAGCERLPGRTGAEATDRTAGSAGLDNPRAGAGRTADRVKNHHPTVKPIGVMRWLCKLTGGQPGSVILDPFMGSGTTGCAAVLEGFDFIGIEREPEYMQICEARIRHHMGALFANGVEIIETEIDRLALDGGR
jgi:DNA modification methylase